MHQPTIRGKGNFSVPFFALIAIWSHINVAIISAMFYKQSNIILGSIKKLCHPFWGGFRPPSLHISQNHLLADLSLLPLKDDVIFFSEFLYARVRNTY